MAIQVVRMRVCDVCGSDQSVKKYRLVRVEGKTRMITMDLCDEHGTPIEELMAAKPVPRRTKRKVTPLAEAKSATKRAPRKKV